MTTEQRESDAPPAGAGDHIGDGRSSFADGASAAGLAAPQEPSGPAGVWVRDDLFVVDGVEFVVTPDRDRYLVEDSTPGRFIVAKTATMVDRMAAAIREVSANRIAELGIFKGGSAALLASFGKPTRLSAFDLMPTPVPALEAFIADRNLGDVVHAHYGVDQSDVELLARLIGEDHGDEPLDLVVDDASHYYRETRASFEVLFAKLRPGGLYIIEDWGWGHFPEPLWQSAGGYFHDRPALTNLVIEILMVAATGAELVSQITVLRDTVTVERGPLRVDGRLTLEDHYRNRGLTFRPVM